jgi:hypothetical protein
MRTTTTPRCLALALLAASSPLALAQVPTQWTFRVVAREGTQALPAGTAFGIPPGAELTQNDPALSAGGLAAIRFTRFDAVLSDTVDGVFVFDPTANGGAGAGSVVFASTTTTRFGPSGVDFVENRLVLPLELGTGFDARSPDGALVRTIGAGGPEGLTGSFSRPTIISHLGAATIAYRANAGSIQKWLVDNGTTRTLVAQTGAGYSFLYGPRANGLGVLAGRADTQPAGAGARIVRIGASTDVIAEANGSPWNSVGNFVDITDSGNVLFFARPASTNVWELLTRTSPGATPVLIARPDDTNTLSNSSFINFPAWINDFGLVALRPNDASGNAIYVADGQSLVRVVGDSFPTIPLPGGFEQPLGRFDGFSRTAIVGNIALNIANQIAFVGKFDDGTDALIIATPAPACDPIDFNRDGVFPDLSDIIDFFFVYGGGPCPSPACNDIDFNNDGIFPDLADVVKFLEVFGGGTC